MHMQTYCWVAIAAQGLPSAAIAMPRPAHLFVVIDEGCPVEELERGLETEHGLLLERFTPVECLVSDCQLLRFLAFCPSKLLEPGLHRQQCPGEAQERHALKASTKQILLCGLRGDLDQH